MAGLLLTLTLTGCNTQPRSESEVAYQQQLTAYRISAPDIEPLRDHELLERNESTYRQLTDRLPQLDDILQPPLQTSSDQKKSQEQLMFDWLSVFLKTTPDNPTATLHYALLVWLGYDRGLSSSKKDDRALELIKQAGGDDAFSHYLTARILMARDSGQASKHLVRASAMGYPPAQAALARMYLGNEGIPRNDAEARKQLALLAGNTGATLQQKSVAKNWLAAMSFYGVGGAQNDGQALQLVSQKSTSVDLIYLKALMLLEGIGRSSDVMEANTYLTTASQQGYSAATNELAVNYLQGKGLKADLGKSWKLFEQAAAAGSATALYNLAIDRLYGYSAPANQTKAVVWLERAKAQGLLEASRLLNYLALKDYRGYLSGKSLEALKQALADDAAKGDHWSCYALGVVLLRGNHRAEQLTGYAWLNVAVALGYQPAAKLRDASGLQLSRSELDHAQNLSQTLFDGINQYLHGEPS